MLEIVKAQQKYRRVYHEVINGYSEFVTDGSSAYVKHVSEYDLGELELSSEAHFSEAKSKGLPTEEEQLDILCKNEIWSLEKEDEISALKNDLSLKLDSHKKLFLKKQIKNSQKLIDELEKKLSELLKERENLMGLTCERFAEKKSNEEIVLYTFFKDKYFQERLFTQEQFDDMHHSKLFIYMQMYNDVSNKTSYEETKRLAALPFFTNLFFLADDDPFKFFGVPISKLTISQVNLFNAGKTYKSILSQGNSPSEEMYQDLDKLVSFYDSYSGSGSEELKEGVNKDAQSIVGATIDEMKQLTKGKGDESVITMNKALEQAEKETGKSRSDLSMEDIAKMHGF